MVFRKSLLVFAAGSFWVPLCLADAAHNPISGFWVPTQPPTATYTIHARVDEAARVLQGSERISLKNGTTQVITQVAFAWPATNETKSVTVVNGVPRALDLSSSTSVPVLLRLPQPVSSGQEVIIDLNFTTPFDASAKSHMLQVWHPTLWWGFPVHSTYVVDIKAPADYAIGTSGWFDEKDRVWRGEHIREFGLFLAKGFLSSKALAGDVQVRAVYTASGSACAHVLLDHAVDAINFYRRRLGFYPYRSLTLVPGMDEPAGGYPAATGLIVVHGQEQLEKRDQDFWRWITAHEIGHQYWYEYVLSRDLDDIGWLLIGLGIYTDREYSLARSMLHRHANFSEEYINAVRSGLDTTMDRTSEQFNAIDWDYNNAVMHGKGFSVISALAVVLGQRTFDRIYRRCLRDYAGRRLGSQDFETVAEAESGQDLQSFFDQWVRSSRYPAYQILSSTSTPNSTGGYISEVKVEQIGTLRMPVPVAADFTDGSKQMQFTDGVSKLCSLRFRSKEPLKTVQLDPDHGIAMVIPLPPPNALDLALRMDDLEDQDGSTALSLKEAVGNLKLDSNRLSKLTAVLFRTSHYEATLEMLRKREAMYSDEEAILAFQCSEAVLLDLSGKRAEAITLYQKALEKIGAKKFSFDELGLKIDKLFLEACLKAPYQRL